MLRLVASAPWLSLAAGFDTGAVLAAISTVLAAAIAGIPYYWRQFVQQHNADRALARADDFARREVRAAMQTSTAPRDAAGKLSPSDADALFSLVVARVRSNLGPAGVAAVASAIGSRDLDAYLRSVVEAEVYSAKLTAPAAASAASVPPPAVSGPPPLPSQAAAG